jgi:signal transduction histidine kinase
VCRIVEVPGPNWLHTVRGRDVLLAVAVAFGLIIGSEFAVRDDLWNQLPEAVGPLLPSTAVLLLLLAESLSLIARRAAPLLVFAVCATASLGVQRLGEPTPLPLGVLVAVYTVAVRFRPLVAVGAAATYLAAVAAGIATRWAAISDDVFYDYLVALVATVGLGYGVALSRASARLAAQHANEQEARLRTAVEQEQSRIAREVHDIVAHDVSVIVAQAAAARRTLPEGSAVEGTLGAIETVGRDALDGLRRLMHLLRRDAPAADRGPQPGLDGIPLLVAQVRNAGLTVELDIRGNPRRLPATVETNAYRIVQEALTNALKHAGGARATVVLDYGADALNVEIRDDGGTGPAFADGHRSPRGSGFGLVSIQQRAALLDGRVDAGPVRAGGFRVSAWLPVHAGER